MKNYIVYTESDYQINIEAINIKQANKIGRKACKRDKEKFNSVRLKK